MHFNLVGPDGKVLYDGDDALLFATALKIAPTGWVLNITHPAPTPVSTTGTVNVS